MSNQETLKPSGTSESADVLHENQTFEQFRDSLDHKTAEHYGQFVIPRIGVLYSETLDEILATGNVVYDKNGSMLACKYTDAYPDYDKDNRDLERTAYLMQPIWDVAADDDKRDKIKAAGFDFILGEIVVPDLYDGAVPHDPKAWQEQLDGSAAELARKQLEQIGGGAVLLGDNGMPLFHYEYLCRVDDEEALEEEVRLAGGRFLETWSGREEMLEHIDEIAGHHIAIFAEHSRKSTPFSLGLTTKEEVQQKLENSAYTVMAHLDGETDRVDATVFFVTDFSDMPCVDPKAFSNPRGPYVEFLSTDPENQNQGIAKALAGYGLRNFLSHDSRIDPKNFTVAFDTAGPSTLIIPAFSATVIQESGHAVNHIRAQSIHHAVVDLSLI